jgi:hypothetical protein
MASPSVWAVEPLCQPYSAYTAVIKVLGIIYFSHFIQNMTFRRLDSISVFKGNLLSCAQLKELVSLSLSPL